MREGWKREEVTKRDRTEIQGRDFSLRPGNEKPLETHKRRVATLWSREKVS